MRIKTPNIFSKSPLYAQLPFTAFAFLALNVLTYIFVRGVMYGNLSRNAENVLVIAQTQIENDLNNPKMYLSGFSRTIRTALMRGNGKEIIQEYLSDLSGHLFSGKKLTGFDGLFGFFETAPDGHVFIEDSKWDIPVVTNPVGRQWYMNAIAAKGEIAETVSYNDIYSSDNVLLYSLCIYDDDGKYLGVIFAGILMIILIRIDKAKNKSDAENRHKSAFLANMSHEIRTPMNAIIGMTTIGKSSGSIERMMYCFTKIENASNHLLGVINDILDMSKIGANKLDIVPAEFELEKMLRRVVNVVNFRVDEKYQKLSVHIDRSIPRTLIGDDQRIAQVIANLLGNAIKFTPEKGSITLAVLLAGRVNDICTLQVSVSDTGIGISREQQEKIFNSFEQAESSTTRKYGGTGLGLAISKSIVEMMGGKIWVQSEPGKGSTFAFTIQLTCGTEKKRGLLSPGINLKNVRILTVDDDPDILTYFLEISQGFGIMCDVAISGEKALQLIDQNGGYHIYFIDWKMPAMDSHVGKPLDFDEVMNRLHLYLG